MARLRAGASDAAWPDRLAAALLRAILGCLVALSLGGPASSVGGGVGAPSSPTLSPLTAALCGASAPRGGDAAYGACDHCLPRIAATPPAGPETAPPLRTVATQIGGVSDWAAPAPPRRRAALARAPPGASR